MHPVPRWVVACTLVGLWVAQRDAFAVDAVAAVLRRRRIVGRQRMLRALDSGRYERLAARFSALLRGHAPRRGAASRIPRRGRNRMAALRRRSAMRTG